MTAERPEVDRYILGERLGEGAHGAVYLAVDPKLDREVAIKVIKPEVIADPEIRRRFHREAKSIAKLHHPSILEVYDYSGETSDNAFIVMERLHGQTLAELVDARVDARPGRPLDAAVVAAAGHEICLALEHAHGQGIIHRDLKPDNVFIEPEGRVVLCDFGIARAFGTHDETAGGPQTQLIGSPLYMSPEQISEPDRLGPPSDFFALGSLLYYLATGRHAFAEETVLGILKRILAGAHPPLGEVRPDLPARLVQTIEGMLRVDVDKRLCDPSLVSDRLVAVVRDAGFPDPRRALKQTLGPAIEEHTKVVRASATHSQVTNVTNVTSATGVTNVTDKVTRVFDTERSATQIRKIPTSGQRSSLPFFIVIALLALVAGGLGWVVVSGRTDAVAIDVPVAAQPTPVSPIPVSPIPVSPIPVSPIPVAPVQAPPVEPRPQPALPAPNSPPKSVPIPAVETQPAVVNHNKIVKPAKPQAAPEPGQGTFKLIALPWAEIYLDYEKVGTTPGFRGRSLSTGRHHLKIMNPNFPTVERDFEIHTNQDTKVTVDLETL